jgi:O-methyltransferase involved in polyketide biosynthesis
VRRYLTPQAVAQAMNQIATPGGPGTRPVFDHILAEVINGTTKNLDALKKARNMARMGEPWLFGLAPDQVPRCLASFGFKLVKDYKAADLRLKYCPQRRAPIDYNRIVVARPSEATALNAKRQKKRCFSETGQAKGGWANQFPEPVWDACRRWL